MGRESVPSDSSGRSSNKGLRYPADPPKVEEIIAVMRGAGDRAHGRRLRALIALLWRAGLRIHEGLAQTEGDLDQRRGSLVIRRGKGGRHWSPAAARADLRRTAAAVGVRRRFAPHQLRHAYAVEMAREGVPLIVIQRQLGPSKLGITSVYLQGIDSGEIIENRARATSADDSSASVQR